ncbi:hypothetical protein IE4872_PD02206 (plasmid) [Rhizobium gallicum]|uniref:Uncharacterized protein n=1 Tax=Rhizobium gallicum TaxID=56730 RepID=A0A1L5NXU6_9HYPH|nr:hypothetical protein IE4872_PD02206 [Rhizobium gallicum]
MAEASLGQTIGPAIALMGAAVVAVPLFRRLGRVSRGGVSSDMPHREPQWTCQLAERGYGNGIVWW